MIHPASARDRSMASRRPSTNASRSSALTMNFPHDLHDEHPIDAAVRVPILSGGRPTQRWVS